jgi:hypothetical protein
VRKPNSGGIAMDMIVKSVDDPEMGEMLTFVEEAEVETLSDVDWLASLSGAESELKEGVSTVDADALLFTPRAVVGWWGGALAADEVAELKGVVGASESDKVEVGPSVEMEWEGVVDASGSDKLRVNL